MPDPAVDDLRSRLQNLGYLSSGVERLFQRDPWRSRSFWSEVAIVNAKAAALSALFPAAFLTAIAAVRNAPVAVADIATLAVLYGLGSFLALWVALSLVAAAVARRPSVAIDNAFAPTAIGLVLALAVGAALIGWWRGFESDTPPAEIALGGTLLVLMLLLVTTATAAAVLSLAIHATGKVPERRRRSRILPMSAAALVLVAATVISAATGQTPAASTPPVIPVTPGDRTVAVVAVDGLGWELFRSDAALVAQFGSALRASNVPGRSAAELWATVASGVPPALHQVRTIESVNLAGRGEPLQAVSRYDILLRDIAPALRVASLEPLPASARARAYVWEITASRGITSAAVNWWVSADETSPSLMSVSQRSIFSRAAAVQNNSARALAIDAAAATEVLRLRDSARVIVVYLPALDIVQSRLDLPQSTRVAASVAAMQQVRTLIASLMRDDRQVILVGASQDAEAGVIASSVPLQERECSLWDVAPTLLDIAGFPASEEMRGKSLLPQTKQLRVPSFGTRSVDSIDATSQPDYYENLKSLGYIQ